MADVFISYSHKDKAFVRKLHQAIEAEGRDATVAVNRGFNALLMLDPAVTLPSLPDTPTELLEATTQRLLRQPPEFTPAEREKFGLN
jgi:hypothetical protein